MLLRSGHSGGLARVSHRAGLITDGDVSLSGEAFEAGGCAAAGAATSIMGRTPGAFIA